MKHEAMKKKMSLKLSAAVKDVRIELEDLYRNRLQYAKQQISAHFQELMGERDKAMCKRAEQKIQDALSFLRKSMAEEMELIARRRVDYHDEVGKFQRIWDANKANEVFKKKTNALKKKWIFILKKARRKSEIEKKEMKKKFSEFHNNELEKIQESCAKEFTATLQTKTYNYRRTICDLLKEIKKKDQEYEILKEEKECAHIEQYSWCYLVRELLKQFQKFVNYTLNKKPGHAEYLLSLEKVLHARIQSLTEVEFLREYIEEKGLHLIDERLMAEDAKLRMQPLKEVKEKEIAKKEYPCLPQDIFEIHTKKKKISERKENIKEIEKILDKMFNKAVPQRLGEMPCIDSDLWSSGKSEKDQVAWPADPQPPGLTFTGDSQVYQRPGSWKKFTQERIKSIVHILNKHPGIMLAVIGNS